MLFKTLEGEDSSSTFKFSCRDNCEYKSPKFLPNSFIDNSTLFPITSPSDGIKVISRKESVFSVIVFPAALVKRRCITAGLYEFFSKNIFDSLDFRDWELEANNFSL